MTAYVNLSRSAHTGKVVTPHPTLEREERGETVSIIPAPAPDLFPTRPPWNQAMGKARGSCLAFAPAGGEASPGAVSFLTLLGGTFR